MSIKRFTNILGFSAVIITLCSTLKIDVGYLIVSKTIIFLISIFFIISALAKNFKELNKFMNKYSYSKINEVFLISNIAALTLVSSILIFLNPINVLHIYLTKIQTLLSIILIINLIMAFYSKRKSLLEINIKNNLSAVILAILVICGGYFRFNNLGLDNIRGDEFQVISSAAGYLNTGDYYRWNWITNGVDCKEKSDECYYDRAWPHTWMVAESYKYFGISEFSSRFPSAVFGTATILLSFFVANFFIENNFYSILISAIVSFSPTFISLSQYTRMYVILIPLFLFLIYSIFRALFLNSSAHLKKLKNNNLFNKARALILKYFSFNWAWAAVALSALYINYQIHINSLIILPSTLIFICILYFLFKKEKKYASLLLTSILTIIFVAFFDKSLFTKFNQFLSFFSRKNYIYSDYIFGFPLPYKLSIIFSLFGFAFSIKEKNYKLIYINTLLFFSLIFFIYVADRYPSYVYSSHLVIVSFITTFYGIKKVSETIISKKNRISFIVLILILATVSTATGTKNQYNDQGNANFSIAYKEIVNDYNINNDLLFMQYGRTFYLRGSKEFNVIDMGSNKSMSLESLLNIIDKESKSNSKIWFSWESIKTGHLSSEVILYIKENFVKIHGEGIDDTGVEVFYKDN